jgi:hypothetical protein
MKSSELINELATALCKAQAVMGGAVKGAANPFFKSKYANLSDVMQRRECRCCNQANAHIRPVA